MKSQRNLANYYNEITQVKFVTYRYKKWSNDTVIITLLKPRNSDHYWFSFTCPFHTLCNVIPQSTITNLHIFLSFSHSSVSVAGWWLTCCYRCFLSPRQSSWGVCSSILEEHIASIFRMVTVSHNQNRYKIYLMFALNVIHRSGSAGGKCCKCWCRAWTGLLHCYYYISLLLRPKMQFGKLFVFFGRLHSKEKAVYCTGNVRNNVDTAVLNVKC